MIYLDYSANTPVDEAVLQRFCEVERNCLEHCINWSARRTEDKSNAGSKRYHNLASTCSGPASMGKDIKRDTHPGYPEMCIRLYIQ